MPDEGNAFVGFTLGQRSKSKNRMLLSPHTRRGRMLQLDTGVLSLLVLNCSTLRLVPCG